MISKYFIFICFPKAHEFKLTRIEHYILLIEPILECLEGLFSNILELGGNMLLRKYVIDQYIEKELTKY